MGNFEFLEQHRCLTRRYFLQAGVAGLSVLHTNSGSLAASLLDDEKSTAKPTKKKADKAGAQPAPYFTTANEFRDVSRGTPLPHSLSDGKRRAVGLTRETWSLEVISDPEHPAKLGKEFTKANGTALDFATLVKLTEKNCVRFAKVMTC